LSSLHHGPRLFDAPQVLFTLAGYVALPRAVLRE
jgi:hypothetical protein